MNAPLNASGNASELAPTVEAWWFCSDIAFNRHLAASHTTDHKPASMPVTLVLLEEASRFNLAPAADAAHQLGIETVLAGGTPTELSAAMLRLLDRSTADYVHLLFDRFDHDPVSTRLLRRQLGVLRPPVLSFDYALRSWSAHWFRAAALLRRHGAQPSGAEGLPPDIEGCWVRRDLLARLADTLIIAPPDRDWMRLLLQVRHSDVDLAVAHVPLLCGSLSTDSRSSPALEGRSAHFAGMFELRSRPDDAGRPHTADSVVHAMCETVHDIRAAAALSEAAAAYVHTRMLARFEALWAMADAGSSGDAGTRTALLLQLSDVLDLPVLQSLDLSLEEAVEKVTEKLAEEVLLLQPGPLRSVLATVLEMPSPGSPDFLITRKDHANALRRLRTAEHELTVWRSECSTLSEQISAERLRFRRLSARNAELRGHLVKAREQASPQLSVRRGGTPTRLNTTDAR